MEPNNSENNKDHQRNLWMTFLEIAPSCAALCNKEGCTPLHIACRHNADNERLIQDLIQTDPSAVCRRIKLESLAPRTKRQQQQQHDAMQQQQQQHRHDMVDPTQGMAHKTHTDLYFSNWTQIRDGSYPLHMALACRHGTTLSVVQALVQAGPHDVMMLQATDKFGNLPLHTAYADKGNLDAGIIAWIRESFPGAALLVNDQGWTPEEQAARIKNAASSSE